MPRVAFDTAIGSCGLAWNNAGLTAFHLPGLIRGPAGAAAGTEFSKPGGRKGMNPLRGAQLRPPTRRSTHAQMIDQFTNRDRQPGGQKRADKHIFQ
jgi:hypothetical protein